MLQSLIASQLVPVVDLREIFRQAAQSAIITSALAGECSRAGLWNICWLACGTLQPRCELSEMHCSG